MANTNSSLDSLATPAAILAVTLLGLSAGALLAEGSVLVPSWRAQTPAEFLAWYKQNASLLVGFFGPLEIAAAVFAALSAGLYRSGSRSGSGLLLVSALLAITVLAAFPLYFREVNASFRQGTIVIDRVPDELRRWATWHWGRTGIAVAAFVSGLLVLRRPSNQGR